MNVESTAQPPMTTHNPWVVKFSFSSRFTGEVWELTTIHIRKIVEKKNTLGLKKFASHDEEENSKNLVLQKVPFLVK